MFSFVEKLHLTTDFQTKAKKSANTAVCGFVLSNAGTLSLSRYN